MEEVLYLVCGKDSELYSEQAVSVMDLKSLQNRMEELKESYDEVEMSMETQDAMIGIRFSFINIFDRDDFYVLEIYPLSANTTAEYVTVWNHGYHGVGFDITIGNLIDAEKSSKRHMEDALYYAHRFAEWYEEEQDLDNWTLDTGDEWEHCEIYSMRDLMEKAER